MIYQWSTLLKYNQYPYLRIKFKTTVRHNPFSKGLISHLIITKLWQGCAGGTELQYTIRTQVCKTIMDYSQEDFQNLKIQIPHEPAIKKLQHIQRE